MNYETINIDIKNQIAAVALDRPDVRNAMNTEMIQEITDVFAKLHKNPDVQIGRAHV